MLAGEEVGVHEIVTLLEARGSEFHRVAAVADQLRRDLVGDVVTFVRTRNINYTNICTFKCRFCAFSKGPLSLNLRGDPYLLDLEEIQRRVVEAVECGATEVCLQGGIHPSFDGDYYLSVARAVKEAAPTIHVHGFTALEVTEGARRLGMPLRDYLSLAKDAGLASLPGTAAEILDDEVRAVICPDKVNTEEWLEAHRLAHSVGLRSNITIMAGHVERPVHVARHLVRTRDLQKETGGFTEFVPLPFVHMASPIYLQQKSRRGPTIARGAPRARRGPYRVPRLGRQHPGVVAEVRHEGRARGAPSRLQRSRRNLDGREHLTGRGGRARPRARRQRLPRHRRPARSSARATHDALRAGHHGRPPAPPASRPRRPGQHRGRAESGRVTRLDVVGIGNALVDVLSYETDDFVVTHELARGAMQLVDTERAEQLYAAMGPATEISGGSAANTMVGVASFGGRAAFVGRVNQDQLGAVFGHDLRAAGVAYTTAPADDGVPTGRCLIVVTPDAQRTLNTYLGASAQLGPDDLDDELLSSAQVLYLEGYLWDEADAKEAFRRAARVAHEAGNRVALTLSDPFCVDRHRAEFLELIEHEVDVLFGNEAEITSLYEVVDFDDALQQVYNHCEIAALTRSEKGSVIVTHDEVHVVDAHPVAEVVDTTGAGDLYAAGFLFGLTNGYDLGTAGRLGALAASEVISHIGARPQTSLALLARSVLEPRSR